MRPISVLFPSLLHSTCRKTNKLQIAILLLLLPGFVLGQEKVRDNFWINVKWTPSSLLTPETPTMQTGVELLFPKFTKNGLSVEFDYGFRCGIIDHYPKLSFTETLDPENIYNKQYQKYRLELRKYFGPVSERFTWYGVIEGFYIPYEYRQNGGEYISVENYWYRFEDAHISKDIEGGAVKVGVVLVLKSRLTIEGFSGVGLRKVNRIYSDLINRQLQPGYHPQGPEEGEKFLPHFALGIKVGYRIVQL